MVVPQCGSLEAHRAPFEPFRLARPQGGVSVAAGAVFFAELSACGVAGDDASFVRDGSAALVPVPVGGRRRRDEATRVEARDFCRWFQVADERVRPAFGQPGTETRGSR